MLTAFGKELRTLRIKRNELLKGMADRLGVSSAYLSAIEHGKKPIPKGFIDQLNALYSFSPEEIEGLKKASIASKADVKIPLDNLSKGQKEVAAVFARKIFDFSEEDIEKMMRIMKEDD